MSAPDFNPGPVPRLEWLPVGDLAADPAYQRSIQSRRSQENIAHIAARFSWALFQVATVARSASGFAVIDGQHRIEAAARLGIETVPCLLIEVASVAEAARLFVDANRNRVTLTAQAMHRALVAAGDDEACAVDRAARAAGVEILPYPVQLSQMKPGQTLAVASIRRIVRDQGEHFAAGVLRAVRECWPAPGGIRVERINGVAFATIRHGVDAVAGALARPGVAALVAAAADEGAGRGVPRWRLIADGITDALGRDPALDEALPEEEEAGMGKKTWQRSCLRCRVAFEVDSPFLRLCTSCRRRAGHVEESAA